MKVSTVLNSISVVG